MSSSRLLASEPPSLLVSLQSLWSPILSPLWTVFLHLSHIHSQGLRSAFLLYTVIGWSLSGSPSSITIQIWLAPKSINPVQFYLICSETYLQLLAAYLKLSVPKTEIYKLVLIVSSFPGGSVIKNLPTSTRDLGLIPGLGRSPGVGNGNALQYSCLENGQRSLAGY